MLGLAGEVAVFHNLPVITLSGNVVSGGHIVVRSVDPIHRVRVICLLVRIVLDAVIALPLLGDVPVAIAQHTFHQQTFGSLRIAF